MAAQNIRALFVTAGMQATGETTTAIALAESVVADGGEVWFLASPLAARLIRAKFPNLIHEMTSDAEANQRMWWRMVRNVRPNVVVFSDIYEIIFRQWMRECPLIDWRWLRELESLDVLLVWIDLMEGLPEARNSMAGLPSHGLFGRLLSHTVRSFLERLSVILPCPLHEPGTVKGRRGIPYRSIPLPMKLDSEERTRVRSHLLGDDRHEDGILILRGVSIWQTTLAEKRGLPLYDYLSELLAVYLADLPKPVTLISVSDRSQLRPAVGGNFRVVDRKSMPPAAYEKLLLSSDLVLTENEGGYMLGKALGNVTPVVLVNSYTLEEVLEHEGNGSPIRRLVLDMERSHPRSIYPHVVYPLRARQQHMVGERRYERGRLNPSAPFSQDTLRMGRLLSSPFLRAELYGGDETQELFHWVLCDPSSRVHLKEQEMAYIERQNKLEDGSTVLKRLLAGGLTGHTVLGGE